MQRVVVDTNTTVSAFLWGGTPRQFFTVAIETGVILLSSKALLQELENTLHKPKLEKYIPLSGMTPSEIVTEFARLVTLVEPAAIPPEAVRDPDDIEILAAAVGGNATHIVSGDKDLLTLGTFEAILILSASEFLERIQSENE